MAPPLVIQLPELDLSVEIALLPKQKTAGPFVGEKVSLRVASINS